MVLLPVGAHPYATGRRGTCQAHDKKMLQQDAHYIHLDLSPVMFWWGRFPRGCAASLACIKPNARTSALESQRAQTIKKHCQAEKTGYEK